METFFIYLLILNLLGLFLMGLDKRLAQTGQRRIPERRLFLTALLGGSVGCLAGMYLFRHKTKHWTFVLGMPMILLAQALLLLAVRLHLLDWLWMALTP